MRWTRPLCGLDFGCGLLEKARSELELVVERVEDGPVGTWGELLVGRYAAPAVMFTLGIALHAFNAFIATTTMPSAAIELGTVSLLSWATAAYLVASIVGGAAA